MKRTLFVDYDSDENLISVGPIKKHPNEEFKPNPILDMGILCEAVSILIRICHDEKIKDQSKSLKDCINHLQKAFINENLKAHVVGLAREQSQSRTEITEKIQKIQKYIETNEISKKEISDELENIIQKIKEI